MFLHEGYMDGFRGKDPDPELSESGCSYEDGWLQGAIDREAGNPQVKYLGPVEELPVRKGQEVMIPKGTRLWTTKRPCFKVAGRAYRVRVHHIAQGVPAYRGHMPRNVIQAPQSPKVVWPGGGGYWCEADVNDVKVIGPLSE